MTDVLEPDTKPDLTPPQDLAAERAVLGSVLLSPYVLEDVTEVGMRGDDFYRPGHETIWETIADLTSQRSAVDTVTVAAALQTRGELARVGGAAYLHQLTADVVTPANVGYYAAIVVDRAHQRRLILAGGRITQLGYSTDGGAVSDLAGSAAAEVDAVLERLHGRTNDDTFTAVDEALDQLEKGVPAYSTGLADLDDVIRGWVPGTLTILAARPRIGKSALGLQTALNVALNLGFPVGITSLEMPRTEWLQRAMANLGKVDYGRMQKSPDVPLRSDEWDKLNHAAGRLRTPLFHLSDRSWASVRTVEQDIRAHTRRVGRPPVLWIVDYLQLLTPPKGKGRESREQDVAAMSRGLKLLAMKTGVAIIAIAQLNRASEQRSDKRPGLSDLRESGSLEQDADRVILLHRDLTPDGDPSQMFALVEKNRQGNQGVVEFDWLGHFQLLQGRKWTPSRGAR